MNAWHASTFLLVVTGCAGAPPPAKIAAEPLQAGRPTSPAEPLEAGRPNFTAEPLEAGPSSPSAGASPREPRSSSAQDSPRAPQDASEDDGIAETERAVAALNRPFKECYGAALRLDPKVAGKVTIATQIAGDGSVRRVTANGATLPEPFVHCLQEAVLASKFGGPGGNGSTVMIPVSFELSK